MSRAVVLISVVQNPEEPLRYAPCAFARAEETEMLNDFDLIALESAVCLKESGVLDEVVVFSMGERRDLLTKALAMGADRAVFVSCDSAVITPEIVAAQAVEYCGKQPDTLWLLGKIGVNFESGHTAHCLAARLGCVAVDAACKICWKGAGVRVTCESEFGIPRYDLALPCVVTADLRLAEPRFPSLPSIVKAKRKPVEMHEYDGDREACRSLRVFAGADTRRKCQFLSEEEFMEKLEPAGI
ncbi:MAG: hypothetical protein IJ268_09435 [Proteobacteria bacterium]|nr:hypothetical protein [Pseudomonadota bacterium]